MPPEKNLPNPPAVSPPAIHTMQQDLAAAAPPSRFELRHKRPLPPSQRMEDLRPQPPEVPLPLPSTTHQPLLPPPSNVPTQALSSGIFLWIAGLILSLILLMITIAIIATL